jgi:Tol biopolymer transport system component
VVALALAIAGLVWTTYSRALPSASVRAEAVGAAAPRPSWPVQLTTHGGLDMNPAFSPHGDAVAFASDRTGDFELYVRSLVGGSAERALTSDGGHNVQPAWSPDGGSLAFHSQRRGGIWVMPARGGAARQVVPAGSRPAWSPDGEWIAFQSDEHADAAPFGFAAQSGSTLWRAEVATGGLEQLTASGDPLGGHAAPSWSRDGRYLAFSVFDGGVGNGVWVLPMATRRPDQLLTGGGRFETVFAPDSRAVYVAGGDPLLTIVPFDPSTGTSAGPPSVVPVAGVPGVRGLTVSADGRRVGFAGVRLDSQIWLQALARDGSPAGPPAPLTSDTSRRNSAPAISPDGSTLAYMSARQGEAPNVWLVNMDGREPVQLTSDRAADHRPNWFPDGKRVSYSSKRDGRFGFWAVDVATRREEELLDVGAAHVGRRGEPLYRSLGEWEPARSMTQAAFSVLMPPSGRRQLFVTGLAAFAPRPLGDPALSVGYPAWSPDDRRIAVEIKEEGSTHAAIVDVATGAVRRLTAERGQTWVYSWSPDGRRVAVAALRDGTWSLRWLDAEGGAGGTITPPQPPRVHVRYPDRSPRGDVVAFVRGEMRGNNWVVELGQRPRGTED